MARDISLEHLHPVFRERVRALKARLKTTPLRLFEGFRSPQRQRELYAQGRTAPGGRVTNADAWQSYHQYGLAADFVLFIDDNWSWATQGEFAGYWERLHEVAHDEGLEWLSWETPHLQLAGLSIHDLMAGRYPIDGDAAWAENLDAAIQSWHGRPYAPSPPLGAPHRPILANASHDREFDADRHIGERYKVIARSGLRLRAGPGTSYDVIGVLEPDQEVVLLGASDEWSMVDAGFDGHADGYCHRGYLEQLSTP